MCLPASQAGWKTCSVHSSLSNLFYAEPARGILLNIIGRRLIGCSAAVPKASAESSTSCCLLQEHPAAQAHTKQSRGIFAVRFAEQEPRQQSHRAAGGEGQQLDPPAILAALTLGDAVSGIGNDKSPQGSYWWNPSEPLPACPRSQGTGDHTTPKSHRDAASPNCVLAALLTMALSKSHSLIFTCVFLREHPQIP